MKVLNAGVGVRAIPVTRGFSSAPRQSTRRSSCRLYSDHRFTRDLSLAATAEPQVADASEKDLTKIWRRFLISQRKQAKLSLAELSRTLVQNSTKGVLSVISDKGETNGFPISSLVAYAAGDDGRPVLYLTDLAPHTSSLQTSGRISLLITEKESFDGRYQKVTLTGTVEEIKSDIEPLKELFLAKIPKADMYLHYTDFRWFKVKDVASVHFITDAVSGNPTVGETTDYLTATADPMFTLSQGVCEEMNAGPKADAFALAEANTGFEVESARFFRVDSLGIDLDCSRDQFGTFTCRIGFASPAKDRAELKERIMEAIAQAHEKTENKYNNAQN